MTQPRPSPSALRSQLRAILIGVVLAPLSIAAAQVSGGTLVFAGNQEPAILDPLLMSGNVNEREVAAQMFETLIYMDQAYETYPGLAESWTASDDKRVWTFDIKDGVSFHNSDPLDAAAVVAVFEFARTNDARVGGVWSVLKDLLASAEVVDGSVVVTLHEPRPDFLIELADPGYGISNVAYIEQAGSAANFEPVGSGPFRFKEWVRGSHVTLERNPDWTWGSSLFSPGPAYLDEVVFRFIPEAQTRLAMLETGETHFIDLLPFADIQRMRDDPRFSVTGFLLPGMPQMNYFNTSIAPTNELAVRQAINYATDQQAIADVVYFGLVEPAYGPLSNAFPEYDPYLETLFPYDPEKAAEILDEAGWLVGPGGVRAKDGQRLAVTIVENQSWNDWVYLLQAFLQDVGFDATVLTTQGPSNTAAIASGEHAVPAMGDVFVSATLMTRDWHSSGYGTFPSGHFWDAPELDAMLEAAELELDVDLRMQKYSEIQRYIMEEHVLMVPVFELFFYAGHANGLRDFIVDSSGYYKYFASAYFE